MVSFWLLHNRSLICTTHTQIILQERQHQSLSSSSTKSLLFTSIQNKRSSSRLNAVPVAVAAAATSTEFGTLDGIISGEVLGGALHAVAGKDEEKERYVVNE